MKNTFLGLLALVFLPACALAVDGVVLINQSTVTAQGGYPYRITAPGSYRLTGNLIVPNTNTTAIQIDSDNVTIDLNGFAIIGPLPCFACFAGSGDGIFSLSSNNITIKNGYIKGVGNFGVSLGRQPDGQPVSGSHGYVVEELHVESAGSTGIAVGENSIVRHNVTTGNGFDGILVTSGVVESNVSNNNFNYGIHAGVGAAVTVVGNFSQSIVVSGVSYVRAHNLCPGTPDPCPDGRSP